MAYISKNPAVNSAIFADLGATTPTNPASSSYMLLNRSGQFYARDSSGAEAALSTGNVTANVRASEGSGTTTLTNSNAREQLFNLSANRTVILPTTGVNAGDQWVMQNPNAFTLTIQSSGANTITTVITGFVILEANVNTPTTAGNWTVVCNHNVTTQSGRYTPSFTNVSNANSITNVSSAIYSRVGNIVTVTGFFDMAATLANTFTTFNMTLPIASDFATAADASGLCGSANNAVSGYGSSGQVYADPTNDRIQFGIFSIGTGAQTINYTALYEIK
jgi:hypothetical protein